MCNRHLSIDNLIDHRSYERQGKLKVPTIHEGADARKIEEKYLTGQIRKGSWKVEENQMIKKQNALLQKVIATFGKVSGALSMWREWLNDIRRKQRSNSHDGSNDYTDRGTAEYHGRDASENTGKGREADVLSEAVSLEPIPLPSLVQSGRIIFSEKSMNSRKVATAMGIIPQ